MSSYQYRKSHCGDKTVVRSSYLLNRISYTGKMSSLYWIRAQGSLYWLHLCRILNSTQNGSTQLVLKPDYSTCNLMDVSVNNTIVADALALSECCQHISSHNFSFCKKSVSVVEEGKFQLSTARLFHSSKLYKMKIYFYISLIKFSIKRPGCQVKQINKVLILGKIGQHHLLMMPWLLALPRHLQYIDLFRNIC